MRCKNCLHALELHDLNEGVCNARVFQTEPRAQNASVPERCDCYLYTPELHTELEEENVVKKLRRMQAIEALLEQERRSLGEHGRYWSKRSRKLEERLRQMRQGVDDYPGVDGEEESVEEGSYLGKQREAHPMENGEFSPSTEGEGIPEPTYHDLKTRVAELEKQARSRRSGNLEFKVGEKGGVSVYALGRFPITLYYEQWIRLLEHSRELRAFLEENKANGRLKLK